MLAKILFLSAILTLVPFDSGAYVFGPTNFSITGYPEHNCHQPTAPYGNDSFDWEMFKHDFDIYKACIEEYAEAAGKDRERVLEKANEAIDEFNSFVRDLR